MRNLIFILSLFMFACTQAPVKTEVAQWRGVNRDGLYNESNLLKSWPKEGPELLWKSDSIGAGYGSPSVTDDKIFVNGEIDSISHVFAFDHNGTLIWKTANGPEFMGEGFTASYPGSRSTPTVIDSMAYAISGLGRLACYDTETGNENWAVDMVTDLNGRPNGFGYAESPLVVDDKVYCMPGGADTNVVALNRFTGEISWISKALSDTVSYCSPMLIELPTRKILVNFSIHNLMGLDAVTGELLWNHEQKPSKYSQPSNTPIYKDGFLYYVQADGNGAVKLEISEDGSSIKEIWRKATNANTYTGFLIHNQTMYNATKMPNMEIRDITTGEITDSLRIKLGNVIAANNMLYCYSENGSISLINITDSINITSKFKLKSGPKGHYANLVIKNGVLYVRHGGFIMAYNIKQTEI